MSKTYLPYDSGHQLLLPAALLEWLPDDRLAYFISDIVGQLDLSQVPVRHEGERRGAILLSSDDCEVLLYGHYVGVSSSRRIPQRLKGDRRCHARRKKVHAHQIKVLAQG